MKVEIQKLIKKYADVYKEFEKFQIGDNSIFTNGDQKTGVIGEYYAKCYIEKKIGASAKYAEAGEPFDVVYQLDEKTIKVQVKTVSSHSKTRIIAPLNLDNKPFDLLYLISLDENFMPNGFYINTFDKIKEKLNSRNDGRIKIVSTTMKGNGKKGSWLYDFDIDKKNKLLEAIIDM